MSIDLETYTASQLSTECLNELIRDRKSFKIIDITDMSHAVSYVEKAVEARDLSCRVYTEYRSAAMGSAAIPTGVTQAVGLFSAIGIGLHNLVTYNPDYELGKNKISKTLSVIYKK